MADSKSKSKEKTHKARKLQKARRDTSATWASTFTSASSRPYAEHVNTAPAGPVLSEEPHYFNRQQLFLLNLSTIPIMFLTLLDASIISTAIPKITTEFHSVLDIGWYGAAYQLANASLQPLAGKLYKYFPPKASSHRSCFRKACTDSIRNQLIFLAFFAIFEFGSLLCGLAGSSKMLIVGRIVAGAGCSGILSGALAMVTAGVPMAKRPGVIGTAMGISQLGLILGPIIGGVLTQKTTWRWCFFCNLPAGPVFALPLAFIIIPDKHLEKGVLNSGVLPFVRDKMDILGLLLLGPSAAMLLVALQYGGNQFPWGSPTVLGLLCGAVGTFALLMFVEHRKGKDAILPLWMISRRIVWCSCLVMAFSVATTFCATYFLPIYFQAVMGASPIQSGLLLLPTIIAQLVSAALSGMLVGRTGYYLPWSVFAGILLTIGCGLMSTFSPTTSPSTWAGYQILLGTGRGLGMSLPITALQNYLDESDSAIGTAFMFFGHTMGGAIFLTMAQTIFTNGLRTLLPQYAPDVSPKAVIDAGVTHDTLAAGDHASLGAVIFVICKSINRVFYMTTVAGFAAFCFAWGIGWKDIRKSPGEKGPIRSREQDVERGGCCLALRGMIFREA
ncbi:major facilitator superfamily domain-containing protein [Cercophora newfieldiana]|uniref:Major facilitator superfamily domain-containing protein n=1 Tax=Cercophora newfieldiana TaxID=92897 RepID=A0AA39YIQ9_9PEZI|nr:major facilitator superfamily domain-containing protein [Cercophora newfieldiana]